MSCPGKRGRAVRRSAQRGQAVLGGILLVMGVLAGALVYSVAGRTRIDIAADKKTEAVLAQAKDALIGYAASHPSQPGILPCPDTDNDGSADSPCGATGATAIGRLPWKQLGLSDLRDGHGECLWYAVSGNFKNSGASGPAVVNPDSPGTLIVNDTSGASAITPNVLAIVFAPGPTLSGQDRSPVGTTTCGGNTTVANYLEGGNQNGAATNTFVTGPATTTFNDKSLAITSDALFNVVNIRVAKEAITALESYYTTNSYYPFANSWAAGSNYNCTNGLVRGRFPINLGACGLPAWGTALPSWFSTNNWNLVTHYAISKGCSRLNLPVVDLSWLGWGVIDLNALAIASCTTEGSLGAALVSLINNWLVPPYTEEALTVTGVSTNVRALVIVTGRATGSQVHPCNSVASCMEDANNADVVPNGGQSYVKPSRFPTSNDRMAMICGSNSPCSVLP